MLMFLHVTVFYIVQTVWCFILFLAVVLTMEISSINMMIIVSLYHNNDIVIMYGYNSYSHNSGLYNT